MTEPISLGISSLSLLRSGIERPAYDRSKTTSRLVHIGVGAFNRSHLAVYLDDLLSLGESGRWGEFGIGLLEGDRALNSALTEQDYLYGLLLMDNNDVRYRVIGSLTGHLFAPAAKEAVIARLASPDCAIVSLTVTEGGYFIDDATRRFLENHPDVRHDLENPNEPKTWVGFVAAACERRMAARSAPFTLLSCDNVHGNGGVARTALLSFAELRDPALTQWIERNVAFPNSMVDRITPRTTDENRAAIAEKFGVRDLAPVVSEPFRQWVLEDNFIAGRPAFERVGVQMTSDVAPYEMMKMRLLNGGHSTLGYSGDLLGYSYIAEAAGDPLLRDLLTRFMAEVRPTLRPVPGINLDEYTASVVNRFSNIAIRDQVARICSDGCAKVAKFLVPSLRDLLAAGQDPQVLPFVIASWLHYLRGFDENGRPMTISDPGLAAMDPFRDAGGGDARLALEARSVFGDIATAYPRVVEAVQAILDDMRRHGVREAIARALEVARTA
ncbi:MAG TPA: mannitol dehydrogenase family protein [Terracidiphilus sp.]|nr:mannitol dehydrogenase family protein [Terracidiphilus sp.]